MSLEPAKDERDPFAGWDNVPLFMRSLPEDESATPAENATLEALQSLMYDGTASEIAANLKEKGNELYASRKWKDAIGFYTRALEECGQDLPVEEKRVLWSNRAAANLELGNCASTLRDISQVLAAAHASYPEPATPASNKTTLKALLRSARALSALDKYPEALDALDRLRILEDEMGEKDKDVGKKVREEVEGKKARKEKREVERTEKDRRQRELDGALRKAFQLRGIIVPTASTSKGLFASCPTDVLPPHFDDDQLPAMSSATVPLSPPLSSTQSWSAPPPTTPLVFPAFLLQPLVSPPTRDMCLEFPEDATFGGMLEAMEQDPTAGQLYVATARGRVLKVGAKLTLAQVLAAANKGGDGVELKDGWALEMTLVPKGSKGEEWIQQWKTELQSGTSSLL